MNAEAREIERKRAAQADIAAKYREIGPAAIAAALACKQSDNSDEKPKKVSRAA